MNAKILYLLLISSFLFGCNDWLTQQDSTVLSTQQAYSSELGISSVAANLYSRLRYEQDFSTDDNAYDLTSWDEAINNSDYWAFANNKNQNYRSYYDYELIRDINLHIHSLQHDISANLPAKKQRYFLAEARFLRAFVYFTLVTRMGGVPIITEAVQYTENTLDIAKPRNKEADVYDFISNELDSIKNDLSPASQEVKTRATKGAALALKCRAMLYAGTLAYHSDKSAIKGLILPGGETGIDKDRTNGYLQKCLDAYMELKNLNSYYLYRKNTNKTINYTEIFQTEKNNPEIIFCKGYDGKNIKNAFTTRAICRSMHSALKTGGQINPTLNLADCYELISTRSATPINPYNGTNAVENMGTLTSNLDYRIFDSPMDIFEDRDPRLQGTIITPGSSFRGQQLDFQAGLAVKTTSGFSFKSAALMENIDHPTSGYYQNVKMTGNEGPHQTSTYVSHSGFLLRKFVDTNAGSEAAGASSVPYTIFRYGEVLLNAAEAAYYLYLNGVPLYNGQNTLNTAINCINEIRERAGGTAFRINDSELTLQRIMNERRVELAFEDHRYYDLKRWRIADEVWAYDRNNDNAVMYGLWPYKIYAPGNPSDGKWIYRKVKIEHRGSNADKGQPLYFDLKMYYATYPITDGNPYIVKNPNH